ncbi:MAG TPA: hypothetical protein VFN35_20105 [Ktedonobacteraceae bacterium]|nr:hypothetical protein [Ktedonobacteraceae bacterium]
MKSLSFSVSFWSVMYAASNPCQGKSPAGWLKAAELVVAATLANK